MRILGVDPGSVSAAFAVIDDDHRSGGPYLLCAVADAPVADKQVNPAGFAIAVRQFRPDVAVIERVGAMPKQGVSSTFKFGMGTGLLRGVIAALGIPLIEVAPTVWKRHFRLDNDAEKSRALAIRRFPAAAGDLARKKDHGRAEALLIALWRLETGDDDVV